MEGEILFIGGCADGQRHKINNFDYYRVPQYNADETVTAVTYRRERIMCGDVPFAVMVENSMSMVTAMQCLLEGYKAKEEK